MVKNLNSLMRILLGVIALLSIESCNQNKKSGGGDSIVICSQRTRETCTDASCTYDSMYSRCRVAYCSNYNGDQAACDGEPTYCRYYPYNNTCE